MKFTEMNVETGFLRSFMLSNEKFRKKTERLKPRLHKQNPPPRVEDKKTGRFKLPYFLQSAEADLVFVGAVLTAV